ncbi:hypothetical protein ACQKGI_15090 [Peribacillus muralis]|uniref:hypothetical protein n=1 Tax=Peribacillus muralis TaxID=264697 RepID=UPI0037F2E2AF
MKYAAVLYYEARPNSEVVYQVALIFPDLRDAGFASYHTVGSSREDVLDASKEILGLAVKEAAERGLTLPDGTPILKINVDHGHETHPFRIIVENISI